MANMGTGSSMGTGSDMGWGIYVVKDMALDTPPSVSSVDIGMGKGNATMQEKALLVSGMKTCSRNRTEQ